MNPPDPRSPTPPVLDVEVLRSNPSAALTPEELADLRRAKGLLAGPGIAVRFANLIGSPIEKGLRLLPDGATRLVHQATRLALEKALNLAVNSMDPEDLAQANPRNRLHKMLAGASGAVGGAFGLGALVFELPISTTLILRSIARIAGSQGHDLSDIHVRLACLEVFALGGDSTADDAAEASYWAVRAALAKLVTEAAGSLAGRGAAVETAPAAVKLLSALAARFGIFVSEEVAAKAVPIVGAATGAAINIVFMDHFQKMAEGHFIIRRLERLHGTDAIRQAYLSLATPISS